VASWAVSEPGRGWAPLDPSLTATRIDTGFRIDGTKDRVEAGAQSAVLLVVARCGPNASEIRQFLVPTDAPGVRIEPRQSVDLVKQYARVHFDGVVVEGSAVVGTAAETATLVDRQSQLAQVLQCAEVVGIVQTVFDFTVQWALDRHTFGRPLASYQALKHGFADMKLWLEACRATTAAAVADVAARAPGAGLSASIAKSYVGEMAGRIVQACVQMHGGIGVTWEHDLHLYLRRVTLYRSMFGTPEEHNLRVYESEKAARSMATAR
jgi:alkylation response protein AidB-like acyl-CoA dehydrogenase